MLKQKENVQLFIKDVKNHIIQNVVRKDSKIIVVKKDVVNMVKEVHQEEFYPAMMLVHLNVEEKALQNVSMLELELVKNMYFAKKENVAHTTNMVLIKKEQDVVKEEKPVKKLSLKDAHILF